MFLATDPPAIVISGPAEVVDGDTIRIGGTSVRLFGVDAPERDQSCQGALGPQRCGLRAAAWLRQKLRGSIIRCVSLGSDRYGRRVATCRANGSDVGRDLVASGWALAYRQYSQHYVPEEASARAAKRGLWSTRFAAPSDFRRQKRRDAAASAPPPPDPSCAIKGNINGKGVRIYHLPGSRAYGDVRIDPRIGERWFCSEQEAKTAGWRGIR